MTGITFRDAALAMNGRFIGDPNRMINGVFTDSREAMSGGLFFAIKGERRDGHEFVAQMLENGCAAVVSDPAYCTESTILVADTKRAIYDLASYYRRNVVQKTKIIAISGSVGKTTTKNMTGAVVASAFASYTTKGNRNSLIGVPLSVFDIQPTHSIAVLEFGMSQPGEIASLSELVMPEVAVLTNIGTAHLQAFGSVENIKAEKLSITRGMPKHGKLILNADDPNMNDYIGVCTYYGIENNCDFRAQSICQTQQGVQFDVCFNGISQTIRLPQKGSHNIYNALAAYSAGVLCGVPPTTAAAALENFKNDGNRQNIYTQNDICIIADCYNASPESMRAALDVLAGYKGRRIAVLGDMYELGEASQALHMQTAEYAASRADELIFVGEMAQLCLESAGKGYAFDHKQEAVKHLQHTLKSGDTVLFKASNGMHLEEIIKDLKL